MIKQYEEMTLEQAQEYQSMGYIVTCNGDGWVLTIKKGSMR